eukprot:gb/GECH01009012.1/.p1 GENE.gb/GECH01009012.1/~~gb/GECH01009012.1/.p1  ORF type:complete len:176 (+),score=23.96 gb/GECH01009012.1/:1-528(+)
MKRGPTDRRPLSLTDYFSGIGRTDLYGKHRMLDEISGRKEVAESPIQSCREMETLIIDLTETSASQLKIDVLSSKEEFKSSIEEGLMILHYNRMYRFYKEMHWRRGVSKIESSRIKQILSTLTTLEKGFDYEANGEEGKTEDGSRNTANSNQSSASNESIPKQKLSLAIRQLKLK